MLPSASKPADTSEHTLQLAGNCYMLAIRSFVRSLARSFIIRSFAAIRRRFLRPAVVVEVPRQTSRRRAVPAPASVRSLSSGLGRREQQVATFVVLAQRIRPLSRPRKRALDQP